MMLSDHNQPTPRPTTSPHNLETNCFTRKNTHQWSKDGLISPSLDHHTPIPKTKPLNIATNINHNIMIYNHNLAKRSFATGVREILSEER